MNKKILSLFILLVVVLGATKALASLTFSSAAITGTTASTIDVGAGNALSLQTTNNGAITTGTGMVTMGGGLTIPMTTSSTTGVIYKGATPFIHNFNYGNNGTVTTDGQNTFVGFNSGNFTMGSTATGTEMGSGNTAIGDSTLPGNTTGFYNSAVGTYALYSNTTGGWNTAVGNSTLGTNTTGADNTALGFQSLLLNTIGSHNTGVGDSSMVINTTGSYNTVLGESSLYWNSTGSGNVALGYFAGSRELGSNAFYVNNINQVNTAGDKAYSLLYGTFAGSAGTTVGNTLKINGVLTVNSASNKGTCVLGTNCASITVATGAICTATDTTGIFATRAVVSGTTLIITGNATDTIAYTCL